MTHYGRFIERSIASLGDLTPEEARKAEEEFSATFRAAHCRLADAHDDFKREFQAAFLPAPRNWIAWLSRMVGR